MADRHHAYVPQVVGREPGQDLAVDGVVVERLLVLAKPSSRSQAATSTSVPPQGGASSGRSLSQSGP